MEETIKGKEVIAYKGMNSDMTFRGFKYELGKSYKIDKVELCYYGFRACLNPKDVLKYYSGESPRYFKVKLSGEVKKCGKYYTQVVATEITILEEITIDELNNITEWWKNNSVLDLLYFSDGFAKVQRGDGLYNLIDKQGNILFNEWYNWVENFREGFAVVQRGDKKYNLIDKKGDYLSDEWYNWVGNFFNGFAVVRRANGEYNFIDKKGDYLSDEWYKYIGNFYDGLAIVQRANGEWCNIDKTGTLIKLQ